MFLFQITIVHTKTLKVGIFVIYNAFSVHFHVNFSSMIAFIHSVDYFYSFFFTKKHLIHDFMMGNHHSVNCYSLRIDELWLFMYAPLPNQRAIQMLFKLSCLK